MYGLVMRRSSPAAPASSSNGNPDASGRLPSSAPTVTPAVADIWSSVASVAGHGLQTVPKRRCRRSACSVGATRSRPGLKTPALRFCLHERQLSVPPIQDAESGRLAVTEDDDAVAVVADRARGVADRHRFDGEPL